jgi:hypothetical protein
MVGTCGKLLTATDHKISEYTAMSCCSLSRKRSQRFARPRRKVVSMHRNQREIMTMN